MTLAKCLRCSFEWTPRFERQPKECPECKSYFWNVPPKEPTLNYVASSHLSYVIGVLRGDGFIRIKPDGHNNIVLSAIDLDFLEQFNMAIYAVLGKKTLYSINKGKPRGDRHPMYSIEATSRDFCRWYKSKTFEELSEIAEHDPKAYLKGIFDSDGGVLIAPRQRTNRRTWQLDNAVTYGDSNERVVGHVAGLLTKAGVAYYYQRIDRIGKTAHFPEGDYAIKTVVYRLTIKGLNNLLRFRDAAGFTIKRKHERLNTLLSILQKYGLGHAGAIKALEVPHVK